MNKRNFEEAFIDNPDGDDQQDIMILGVHDRNRALDGDMVVLKIKERSEWIIRDAMYMAWRSGQLNMACDEDGQPISVPPVPNSEKEHNFEVLQVSFYFISIIVKGSKYENVATEKWR